MKEPKQEFKNCEICGTPCIVVGKTTLHYKPVTQEPKPVEWEKEFDKQFKITEQYMPHIPVYWVKFFIRQTLEKQRMSVEEIMDYIKKWHYNHYEEEITKEGTIEYAMYFKLAQSIHDAQENKLGER